MVMIWERCEGRCAVSGLEFSNAAVGIGRARYPFMPSLDQIEPGKRYTADNVRLVCVAANFAMNALGLRHPHSSCEGCNQQVRQRIGRSGWLQLVRSPGRSASGSQEDGRHSYWRTAEEQRDPHRRTQTDANVGAGGSEAGSKKRYRQKSWRYLKADGQKSE